MIVGRNFRQAAAVLAAVVFLAGGCGRRESASSGRMLVAASIAPLADFARNVGGDLVEVELLVPTSASPHVYQLEPNQMRILSRASVLVLNGVGLEFWADSAIDAADNPKLKVVRTAEGIEIIGGPCDHGHDHTGGNPHVWLSPTLAIHQVKKIRDTFADADPDNKATYAANADAYIRQLRQLDEYIQAEVKTFSNKRFIAFHPAWVYFARDYGLTQAAVIEESPGREPSSAELREVVKTARKLKAEAIFAEPQFSPKAAEVIAEEAGAKVLILDPLGQPPDYDYIKTMRTNLDRMAQGLKQ